MSAYYMYHYYYVGIQRYSVIIQSYTRLQSDTENQNVCIYNITYFRKHYANSDVGTQLELYTTYQIE